ncbi:MAG: hypothetical protein ABIF10_04005 [Candidatus Woesearchaeota archaeon]
MRHAFLLVLVLAAGFDPGIIADNFVSDHAIFHHGPAALSDVFLSRQLSSFQDGYASFLYTASSHLGDRRIEARFIVVVDMLSVRVCGVIIPKRQSSRPLLA